MTRKFLTLLCTTFLTAAQAMAADGASRWMRGSAISPNGARIAFSYKGDIYTVPTEGGQATRLTTNTSYDASPVWSPDSRTIAFTSDREGSLDVFIVSVEGGQPKRLTTHSGNERPVAWLDADHVLYAATGTPTTEDIQFPSGTYYHIYKVGTDASRPERFSELTMAKPVLGPAGQVLYSDVKGYEDQWRKHQTSSLASDIWLRNGDTFRRLTTFKGQDANPVWAPDGKSFYYLSEQSGTFNVHHRTLDDTGDADKRLTSFKGNPVRYLSTSNDGLLCFGYDGEIYTLRPGSKPAKVRISIVRDEAERAVTRRIVGSGAEAVAVSPKTKEIAFILEGDVYVTTEDHRTTKRITDTPERERVLDFAPDGRSIIYDSERDGRWQIYRTRLTNEDETGFTYCTAMEEECLTDGKRTSFQPQISPDGTMVAFLEDRTAVCVMDLKTKEKRVVMDGKFQYSYTDYDQDFAWSPDSKWLLTKTIGTGGWNIPDIALVRADGKGEMVNLTQSGYSCHSPQWVLDGKAILYVSDRAGYRSHGSWGAENDVYLTFLDIDAYERFRMNKEDLALLEAREKAEKEKKAKAEKEEKEKAEKDGKKKDDKKKKDEKADKDAKAEKKAEPAFVLTDLDRRTVRLTPYSTNLSAPILSKDGSKLFYLAPHEGSTALWIQHIKDHRNELKMKGVSFHDYDLSADGKDAYTVLGGQIRKLNLESGRMTNIAFDAFVTERPAERRAYYFEHIWEQTKEKLYDPKMNGADWDRLRTTYEAYLPHINNYYDFAEMASELLGELNVSHTGCRFGGYTWAMSTASFGVFYDEEYKGDGLKIKEIMSGSPLEYKKNVGPGCIIQQIDGMPIEAGMDYYPLLAGKAGRYTRLTIAPADGGKAFDLTVKPLHSGSENSLLYDRWVKRNERMVDSLSSGRLAYVHIQNMDSPSFRKLYHELLSDKNRNREAVIVDTRHNGGGWLHNDVCILLTGKQYMRYQPRGQFIGTDPHTRWVKPSCMLVCEDNYSNAHGTPWLYQQMGIGKLIGAPVPGTMTAVWWEDIGDGIVFGIPQVGALDNNGNYLENQQLNPDIEVYNTPAEQLSGVDRQIERAVRELLGK